MASLTIPYDNFVAGTTIVSQQVDDNNDAIVDYINARNAGTTTWDAVATAGALSSTLTSNQIVLGTTRTVTISAGTPASSSRTWTIPDITADGTFMALEGSQTITGAKTVSNALWLQSISTAGTQAVLRVRNTDNTNGASSARFDLVVGGGSGGDPFIFFDGTGTDVGIGLDNSDSNRLKFSNTTGVGTNDRFILDVSTGWGSIGPNATYLANRFGLRTDSAENASFMARVNNATGDPYYECVTNSTNWSFGCDNSDSDAFVFSASDTIGTSNVIRISTAGLVRFADGSAGAPVLTFASDTNTGIYTAGGDLMGFSAGGTGICYVGSSGHFPVTDNAVTSGADGLRWSAVWAANGTIQTSMISTKENVRFMEPSECRVPKPIAFTRPWEKHGKAQIGFAADNLPEEAHPVVDNETGKRSETDVYTSAVLAMLCLAARNDYEEIAKVKERLDALEAKGAK